MEGIILEPEALASAWGAVGGLILLVLAFASILIGSMLEKEKSGRRLDAAGSPQEKLRRAA